MSKHFVLQYNIPRGHFSRQPTIWIYLLPRFLCYLNISIRTPSPRTLPEKGGRLGKPTVDIIYNVSTVVSTKTARRKCHCEFCLIVECIINCKVRVTIEILTWIFISVNLRKFYQCDSLILYPVLNLVNVIILCTISIDW